MQVSRILSVAAVALGLAATAAVRADDTLSLHHALTAEKRDGYLADAERSLRSRASVTPEFWDWLAKHPAIRAGLLSSASPVPAAFAENLDDLRKELGPDLADRYASLLLGASLGERFGPTQAAGGDGAYNASAYTVTGAGASPEVAKVAAYLKEKQLTLVDFVGREQAILGELGLSGFEKKKENGNFLNEVAFATGTYPPHETLPVAAELRKTIAHYETKLPVFADKGPEWPLFPLDTAPWPLLAPMRQTISDREMDYLWDHFTGKSATGVKRFIGYSRYTFDYDKPEVRYKASDWYPSSIPRIIEDGGVCGRQSTLCQLSEVGLGRPAMGMYQPGHRALMSYRYDAKTGHYSAIREQSITTPDKSTTQWYLPLPLGPRAHGEDRPVVGMEYHVALALAMNVGLDRYTDSRIAFQLAQHLPAAERDQKRELLASAANLNPYDLDAWFALAGLAGHDTAAINQLVQRLDQLLLAPDAGLAEEKELSADTDLSQHAAHEQTPDLKRDSNLVADLVGDAILEEAYGAALADAASREANRAALRLAIERRSQLGIEPGGNVAGLLLRYNIAVDGPTRTEQLVATEIQDLTAAPKARRHKQNADVVKEHVAAVLEALPQPAARVSWLYRLCTAYPAAQRFHLSEGKAQPEALYGYLYEEMLKSLKATGVSGRAESKRLATELESARANFESTAKKS